MDLIPWITYDKDVFPDDTPERGQICLVLHRHIMAPDYDLSLAYLTGGDDMFWVEYNTFQTGKAPRITQKVYYYWPIPTPFLGF